jgi:hypothetical protein
MTYVSIKDLNDTCFNKRPQWHMFQAFYWNMCHWGLLLKHVSLRSFIETCVIEVFYWNICQWGLLLKHMSLRSFIETCDVLQIKKQMTSVLIRDINDKCFNLRSKWHVFHLEKQMISVSMEYINDMCFNTYVIEVFYWNICHWGLLLKHMSLRSFIETCVIEVF